MTQAQPKSAYETVKFHWDAIRLESNLRKTFSIIQAESKPVFSLPSAISIITLVLLGITFVCSLFVPGPSTGILFIERAMASIWTSSISLVSLIFFVNLLMQVTQANRFAISSDGICCFNNFFAFVTCFDKISWENISAITSRRLENDSILVEIRTNGAAWRKNKRFLLNPKRSHNLTRLAESISAFAPKLKIADDFFENLGLNSSKESAYTQMFLQSLRESVAPVESNETGPIILNNRYKLLRRLGSGGQGTAYLVEVRDPERPANPDLRTEMVLKEFILPFHAGQIVAENSYNSIAKSYDALRQLNSDHIVKVQDLFLQDGRAYIALERLSGISLRELVVQEGPRSENESLALCHQMCNILESLHQNNPRIIHRDFTPENLMLTQSNKLVLIDFDVAQFDIQKDNKIIAGKKAFSPPEQLRGEAVPATDIYAMGATLSYLLTGIEPEPITPSHPKSSAPSISDNLDSFVNKLTTLSLADRPSDIKQVRKLLVEI